MLALANEEGEALSKRGAWEELTSEHTFVTTATEAQTNAPVPADLRKFKPNSFFNRTAGRRLIGPITPQQFQALKAQPVHGEIFLSFRQRRGVFLISPAPPAGDTIAYEFVSKYWAKSDAAAPKAAFSADTDGTYLDEELIIQGLRWRFKQANGLDYAEDLRTYEISVEQALGESGGAGALTMGSISIDPGYERPNVPEGGFGL